MKKAQIPMNLFLPIILIIAVVVLGTFIKSGIDRLEAVGIADDYLMYDDFSREGSLDQTIFDVNKLTSVVGVSSASAEVTSSDTTILASGGFVKFQSAQTNALEIIAIKLYPGMHFKTRFLVSGMKCESSTCNSRGDVYAFAELMVGDTILYKCKNVNNQEGVECNLEAIPSFEDDSIYTIKVNGLDSKTVKVSDGDIKLRLSIVSYSGDMARSDVGISIDYMKYKYPYSCKINDDEVLVFDTFAEGSTVDIDALSYEPVKFCLDYPVKSRSYAEDGIKTDIRGEILQRIVQGKSVVVPEYEEYKVFYITKYSSGLSYQCDVDEAFNTNTKNCESMIEKAIVGCEKDSDCFVPCEGITATCNNYACTYNGSCTRIIIEKEVIINNEVEVIVDHCVDDSDCESFCDGIIGSCIDSGKGKDCKYTGICKPENVQCTTVNDCPQIPCDGMTPRCTDNECFWDGECESDVVFVDRFVDRVVEKEVFVDRVVEKEVVVYQTEPAKKSWIQAIIDWFKSIF